MEKNLAEHSNSFAHKNNDDTNAGDTSPSPLPEPNNVDAKPDGGETEKSTADHADHVHGEPQEEKKDEAEGTGTEIETVEIPPETPPPSLENVSEDIDRFLEQKLSNENNNAHVEKEDQHKVPDFLERFLDLVEKKVSRYDTGETKWGESPEEDSSLLEAVNRISKLMKMFSIEYSQQSEKNEKEKEKEEENEEGEGKEEEKEKEKEKEVVIGRKDLLVNGIGAIQQRAMSYLEEEFRLLMEEHSRISQGKSEHDPKGKHVVVAEPSDAEPAETVMDFPGFPEEAVTVLNKIAREMITGGYESECCHVYAVSRKNAFEESLHNKIGFEKISIDEVQRMQWESLEREIPTWINTFKECATVWFPGERRLAESVFAGNLTEASSLYGNLARSVTIELLNFAEGVAMTKRASEKLFKLLDMYETLRDAIPNLESLFPEEIIVEIKAETTSAKCRLGEAAVLIFCEIENSIKSETGKTPVAGGAVHPLTRWIVNYMRLACEYKDTLEEVFREHSKIERADSTSRPDYNDDVHQNQNHNHHNNQNDNNKENTLSPFAAQLMRVMELLDSNLEGKAKLYKEIPLSCIFMMNNGRYIVQKIKGSTEIYQVMGETWCRKRSTELRTYHKNYQIETWSKILSALSPKGVSDHNGRVQKPVLKERFKAFNALFEEIHKTQSTWVVCDNQLQSELRVSISALVIPAYRSFLGRFSQYLDPGRQTEKYIKFQAEDVETYIDELFDGNPHPQGMGKKKA